MINISLIWDYANQKNNPLSYYYLLFSIRKLNKLLKQFLTFLSSVHLHVLRTLTPAPPFCTLL